MKKNFTNEEISKIVCAMSGKLFTRVNKAGNIEVINPARKNKYERFVLYLTPNGRYLWRRWFDKFYCYPLNRVNRNDKKNITVNYDGSEHVYEYYDWAKNAEFDTVDEAIKYFTMYMKRYHSVKI